MPPLDTPQKIYLFTDVRHICCGDLQWLSQDGGSLPVAGPPDPPQQSVAVTGYVPHGI